MNERARKEKAPYAKRELLLSCPDIYLEEGGYARGNSTEVEKELKEIQKARTAGVGA